LVDSDVPKCTTRSEDSLDRGVDDARNIVRIVQWMSEQGVVIQPN